MFWLLSVPGVKESRSLQFQELWMAAASRMKRTESLYSNLMKEYLGSLKYLSYFQCF